MAAAQPAAHLTGTAVAVIDSQGMVIGWSADAEALMGYTAADVVNRSAEILLTSHGETAATPSWADHVRAREGWSGVVEVRHRDGHGVHVGLQASPMSGADGRTDWLVSAAALSEALARPILSESVLDALLDHAPIGLAVWDRALRCTWLNNTAERRSGALSHQRLGRRLTESVPGLDTKSVEAAMARVLETGEPVIDREFRWISPEDEEDRVFSASYFRLEGADGSPLGVCSVAVDISNSWARERLAVLNEAGTRIGSTLDVMSTAQELADVTVPLLADFVTVDLEESVQLGEDPPERLTATAAGVPVFRRAGVASIHAGAPESSWARGEPVVVPPSSPFARAFSSGQSHFEPELDTSPGTWFDDDPQRAMSVRETGIHSMMVIPLKARGVVLGVATLVRTTTDRPFTRDNLLLAQELVTRASLSLDNARRYTRERAAALALQRQLLPRSLSGGSAVDVASRYLPTDTHDGVGGDWFDVIPLSGARVALVVGDVVGHGINAAATMGRLRTAVNTLADMDLAPDELLAHLDDLVTRMGQEEAGAGSDEFAMPVMSATCVYAVYDPVTRKCTIARAGHPPPAIVDPSGRVTFPDLPSGTPIGLGLMTYESVELELPVGSVIALYTDGLIETRQADIDTGLDRLGAALSLTGKPLEDLCAQVVDTIVAKTPSEDDVALLLARTHSLSPQQVASWNLPAEPAAVSGVRSLAVGQLSAWGLEFLGPNVELIVSELVTNAVRYGASPIRLRLIRDKSLVCEVADAGPGAPRMRHARAADESGRGIFLVSELSNRWGTRFAPGGKIAWAEMELPANRSVVSV
ncbi:SpoIIE family protein phosphatase [Streptomyces sp. NPDC088725]|uniref:SpoIIE family protein phosphatase n=1 Tax=Streptomyces sp. NPDC088725 TaxID=3365873 RepID=UPI00380C8831